MSTAITSASTYLRAFSANSDIKDAVGGCQHTTSQKLARIIISVLTLGLGYGVLKLMDANTSRNNIEQFCDCAPRIHNELSDAVLRNESSVTINFSEEQKITFSQILNVTTGKIMVMIFDGTHHGTVEGSLESICSKLENDFYSYPGCYRIDGKEHKSLSERKAAKTGLENVENSIPSYDEFENICSDSQEAKAKRLAAANHKFNQYYPGPAPDPDARNHRTQFQTE